MDDALGPVGGRSVFTGGWAEPIRVAPTSLGFVVVWREGDQIWARRLNPAGTVVGDAVRVSAGFESPLRPAVTVVEDTVLISWPQTTGGNDRVYVQRYTPALVPLGPAFPVGTCQRL